MMELPSLFFWWASITGVPDGPVVHVAGGLAGSEVFVVGAGRAGPVGRLRVEAFDDAWDGAAEEQQIILPDLHTRFDGQALDELAGPRPGKGAFGLVVAAPHDDAGVIAETGDLVFGFLLDVLAEPIGAWLPVVAEHEVLPDHDAQFVADVVELVGLVVAAAPVADHIHVGVAH